MTDKKDLVETITSEIKEIGSLIEGIRSVTDANDDAVIHRIDIDLCLSKTRDLYERICELKNISSGTGLIKENTTTEDDPGLVDNNGDISAEKTNTAGDEEPEEIEKQEKPEDTDDRTLFNQKLLDFDENKPAESPDKGSVTEQETKSPKAETVGEKYSGTEQSVNEKLAKDKQEKDVATKLQYSPITNLVSAIGINDRYKYTNELFDGDKNSFEQTIGKLDAMNNLDEAIEFISNNFSWDETNDSYNSFMELIYRRFAVVNEENPK